MLCRKCGEEIPDGSVFCSWCGVRQAKPPRPRKTRSNGEGSVYQTANGKWKAEVSIYCSGVRCRATKAGFKTKREALEYLPAVKEQALANREHPNNATVQQLYDQLVEKWYPTLSKDKASHYRTAWAAIAPIHKANIRGLRYGDLQPLIDGREGGYYPKRDVKALLRKLYELALKYEYADKNYASLLELPPMKAGSRTALTPQEVQRIWQDYQSGHPFSRYWLIMLYTGMRTGELRTIRKANVHLEEQYCTGGIKTAAGKARPILFCDKIMPLVRQAYREGQTLLCEADEKTFYSEWRAMCARTGLENMDPYTLRHTTGSLLAAEGVAPAVIQQIMGHARYSTTAEHYTHIQLADKLEALNRLK